MGTNASDLRLLDYFAVASQPEKALLFLLASRAMPISRIIDIASINFSPAELYRKHPMVNMSLSFAKIKEMIEISKCLNINNMKKILNELARRDIIIWMKARQPVGGVHFFILQDRIKEKLGDLK